MDSKKWIITFFATIVFIGAGIIGFNFFVDPYGVFDNIGIEWPSYEMTMNPRAAKITYLKDHHEEYDSYIIGCSSTSSFPTEQLNEYFDASFYNMIMYGADTLDTEQTARYLIENYEVKNLIINIYLDNAVEYDWTRDSLSYQMSPEVSGENPLGFYSKYLFLDPRVSLKKIKDLRQDTYLQQGFDVFNAETGAYDKKVRDAEHIGNMEEYLAAYPAFVNYPTVEKSIDEEAVAGTLKSIAAIRDLCEQKGIRFMVVCAPVYQEYLSYFDWDAVEDFYTRLASVTPYWDFSMSSVSCEPRYFYDETHFRNCVGKMALARIAGDDSVYIPEDFGVYVTPDNAEEHFREAKQVVALDAEENTADVPVLMYHHIDEQGDDSATITPELFEQQIAALKEAGYTAVMPDDLLAYVNEGAELPDKPVVITFDDGYLSNYEYAYPILKQYGMCATIFVIGSTVGNTEHYKDTEYPITPHFSFEQAQEMIDSGVISIQSHTYDMHQWADYESGRARQNILRWEDESEEDYRKALTEDCEKERQAILDNTTESSVHVLAYPGGANDILAQETLQENGFDVTFTITPGCNTLVRGIPQSLIGMKRYNICESVSVDQVLEWVSAARG